MSVPALQIAMLICKSIWKLTKLIFCGAEPIVESWPLVVTYSHCASLRSLTLTSQQRLNIIATPAALRSLGDLRCFMLLFTSPGPAPSAGPSALVRQKSMHWLPQTPTSAPTMYRRGYFLQFASSITCLSYALLSCATLTTALLTAAGS